MKTAQLLGSGLEKSLFLLHRDNLAHRCIMQTQDLGYLFQGIAVADVCLFDPLIALLPGHRLIIRKKQGERWPARISLGAGNLFNLLSIAKMRPHPRHKILASQKYP